MEIIPTSMPYQSEECNSKDVSAGDCSANTSVETSTQDHSSRHDISSDGAARVGNAINRVVIISTTDLTNGAAKPRVSHHKRRRHTLKQEKKSYTGADFIRGSPDLDSRHAWLVLASGFIVNVFTSQGSVFAIYFSSFTEAFHQSNSSTSWVGSICSSLLLACAIFTGSFVHMYGVRRVILSGGILVALGLFTSSWVNEMFYLYVTYGVLIGVGSSLCDISGFVIIGQYFEKHRPLATGILGSGSSIGTVTMPPLITVLTKTFGWRVSLRIQSAIVLVSIVLACLTFRPVRLPANYNPAIHSVSAIHQHHRSYRVLIQDKYVAVMSVGFLLLWLGINIPMTYVVKYAATKGISSTLAAWCVSSLGAFAAVGRIFVGYASEHMHAARIWVFIISVFLSGVVTILIFACNTLLHLLIVMGAFGLLVGIYIALTPLLLSDLATHADQAKTMSITNAAKAPSILIGSPLAAIIVSSSSYTTMYCMAGASMIVSALIFCIIPVMLRMDRRRSHTLPTTAQTADDNHEYKLRTRHNHNPSFASIA